jgi:predicted metal-dependent RNase
VEQFSFSGHASRETIVNYVRKLKPKKVLLVHGDPAAVAWVQESLKAALPSSEIVLPIPGVGLEI